MKPLVVVLLFTTSIQAQSVADAARKERERRSNLRSVVIFASQGKAAETQTAPAPAKELPKPQPAPPPDPIQIWNSELDKLRARIRALQDQETALQLQQNEIRNQVYAPVTDPATQEQAQARLGQNQQQLAAVRTDLDQARKSLDDMLLQGPPKK